MKCPRCETATLDERDRDGVTIDVCTSCRGIWFDRGEVEKLITRTTAEIEQVDRGYGGPSREPEQPRPPYRERERDSDHDDYRRRHPRKRSWMESLGDIFD